jgi:hypothetical protein
MTGEEWVVGGQPFYGQEVGVLLLDARYPRLPGDVGHAATYRWPVQFEIVEGLTADRLIHHFDDGIPPLVARSVDRLIQRGARVVVGGCGFFARVHAYVRQRSRVPFLSSSLLQVPWLRTLYGDPIGVLTIDAEALDDHYLGDCGWSRRDPVVIEGIDPASMFAQVYFENRDRFDPRQMEADVVAAARRLAARPLRLRQWCWSAPTWPHLQPPSNVSCPCPSTTSRAWPISPHWRRTAIRTPNVNGGDSFRLAAIVFN